MALTEFAQRQVQARLKHLRLVRDRAIVDGDTHPSNPALYPAEVRDRLTASPDYYQGRPISGPELLADMDRNRVDLALSWQNPAVLVYGADPEENFERLRAANRYIVDLAVANPTRIIPAGWTDPKALGLVRSIDFARMCVTEWGCPVVKMNPAQNGYRIDSDDVLRVVDAIVELGAVPAFHFGGDTEFTPAEGLEAVARRHLDHPVIGVHMGGGGAHFVHGEALYQAARALGLRCPNIFYILSAKRDTHIESDLIAYRLAGEPYRHNLAVASDVPYGCVSWNIGGFLAMFADLRNGERHRDRRLAANPSLFDDATVQDFMGRNLIDLIIAADTRLLGEVLPETHP